MIYQQQTAVADAPAMRDTMADALGLSSSFFCAAAAAATVAAVAAAAGAASAETAAASSGSCYFCAAAAATAAGADAAVADSANSCQQKGVGVSTPAPLFFCLLRFIFLYLPAFCTLQIDLINRCLIDNDLCPLFLGHAILLLNFTYYLFYENRNHSLS